MRQTQKKLWHVVWFLVALIPVPLILYLIKRQELPGDFFQTYLEGPLYFTLARYQLNNFHLQRGLPYLVMILFIPVLCMAAIFSHLLYFKRRRLASGRPIADAVFYPALLFGGAVLLQILNALDFSLEYLLSEPLLRSAGGLWTYFNAYYFAVCLEVCVFLVMAFWLVDYLLDRRTARKAGQSETQGKVPASA